MESFVKLNYEKIFVFPCYMNKQTTINTFRQLISDAAGDVTFIEVEFKEEES